MLRWRHADRFSVVLYGGKFHEGPPTQDVSSDDGQAAICSIAIYRYRTHRCDTSGIFDRELTDPAHKQALACGKHCELGVKKTTPTFQREHWRLIFLHVLCSVFIIGRSDPLTTLPHRATIAPPKPKIHQPSIAIICSDCHGRILCSPWGWNRASCRED